MDKRFTRLFYSLPMVCALLSAAPANAQTTAFEKSYSDNGSTYYSRIPAITKLNDGSLLLISDKRNLESSNDIGGTGSIVSVVGKIYSNGTLGDQKTLVAGTGSTDNNSFDYAHGDAAVVTDSESGKILLMCASGSVSYNSSTVSYTKNGWFSYTYTRNLDNAIRIGRYYSEDNGSTWSGEDITADIYGIYDDATTTSYYSTPSATVTKAFFGSGRICQSKVIKTGSYYRLYAALTTNVGSLVVYSDDFGASWNALGGTSARPCSSGDEAKVEELPDGNVLLSCKGGVDSRYFNIYTYTDQSTAAGSWGTASVASDITTASCNGEILIVPAKNTTTHHYAYVALQSVPASSSDRKNVSIYYKALETATDFDDVSDFTSGWTKYEVSTTLSAYSTMTLDDNGDVAFLYEENVDHKSANDYYNILFQSLSLSTITGGAYTTNLALDYDQFLAADNDWVGKVVTMKVGVTADNETTYYYIKDTYDEENNKPALEVVPQSSLPSTLDKSYYWVISKDPGADYYYLSSLHGDGYLGKGTAKDYHTGKTTQNGVTCTDDKDNLYEITEFTKSATVNSKKTAEEMEGYAIKFAFTDSEGNSTYRLVALGVGNDTYELNWLDHTTKGTTDVKASDGKSWSTDFIFTEVPFAEPVDGKETFVNDEKPSHSGFPVKFTRSDDDYAVRTIDGVTEDYNRYATLNLPYAVELPAGVTAYKVSSLTAKENTNVVLEKYLESTEGDLKVLPRETPVLLSMAGEKCDGKVQTIEYLHPALAQTIVETGLKGSLGKKKLQSTDKTASNYYSTDDQSIYVLSKKNGRVAFYWLSTLSLAANKAYYATTGKTYGVIGFSFDGDDNTSGMTMPAVNVSTDANAPVYDLMGRRVAHPSKGIYIKAGKKFIVR